MRSLYTPMLVLTVLVLAHVLVVRTPVDRVALPVLARAPGLVLVMGLTAAVLLSPVLIAYGGRIAGRPVSRPGHLLAEQSARPGPAGVRHAQPQLAVVRRQGKAWIEAQRVDGFAELTAALPLVVARRDRRGMGRSGLAAAAPALAVDAASFARSRLARSCTWRESTPTSPALGAAALRPDRRPRPLAIAVWGARLARCRAVVRVGPDRHRPALAAAPATHARGTVPRSCSSSSRRCRGRSMPARSRPLPSHRGRSATDVRVLSLPIGVRDGTSSLGDFNPLTQYQQTVHGKRLVGGYLSQGHARTEAVVAPLSRSRRAHDVERTGRPGAAHGAQRRRAYASRDRFLTTRGSLTW